MEFFKQIVTYKKLYIALGVVTLLFLVRFWMGFNFSLWEEIWDYFYLNLLFWLVLVILLPVLLVLGAIRGFIGVWQRDQLNQKALAITTLSIVTLYSAFYYIAVSYNSHCLAAGPTGRVVYYLVDQECRAERQCRSNSLFSTVVGCPGISTEEKTIIINNAFPPPPNRK